jgi:hypothetical protein
MNKRDDQDRLQRLADAAGDEEPHYVAASRPPGLVPGRRQFDRDVLRNPNAPARHLAEKRRQMVTTGLCPECGARFGHLDSDGTLVVESEPGPGVTIPPHHSYARFICDAGAMQLYGPCGHLILAAPINDELRRK